MKKYNFKITKFSFLQEGKFFRHNEKFYSKNYYNGRYGGVRELDGLKYQAEVGLTQFVATVGIESKPES